MSGGGLKTVHVERIAEPCTGSGKSLGHLRPISVEELGHVLDRLGAKDASTSIEFDGRW